MHLLQNERSEALIVAELEKNSSRPMVLNELYILLKLLNEH